MRINIKYPQVVKQNIARTDFTIKPKVKDKRDLIRMMESMITGWVAAPSYASGSVENLAPTEWVLVFSEAINTTDETGFDLLIGGVSATITGVAGAGTDTLTFTTTETVVAGDVLTFDYDSSTGDVASVEKGKDMESITGGSITNNVI